MKDAISKNIVCVKEGFLQTPFYIPVEKTNITGAQLGAQEAELRRGCTASRCSLLAPRQPLLNSAQRRRFCLLLNSV